MIGKRVYPNADGQLLLAEGDYGMLNNGEWLARPPGQHAGSLARHNITVHDDGTITASPSILITGYDGDQIVRWHGYLERGVWREC